jgi:hypothetical protein
MTREIEIFLFLLIAIAAVGVAASRLRIPPVILLTIAGVLLALVPGLPAIRLPPELGLLLVLPPLIYSSAVAMSWRVSLQPAPDLFACHWLCRVYHRDGCRRRVGSWDFLGRSDLCSARLFHLLTPWRRFR